MKAKNLIPTTLFVSALVVLLLAVPTPGAAGAAPTARSAVSTESVLVQGTNVEAVAKLVKTLGGTVTHELGIINAVAAELTPAEFQELRALEGITRLYGNSRAQVSGRRPKDTSGSAAGNGNTVHDTAFPTVVAANQVHELHEDGAGVTIAVIDTGMWKNDGVIKTPTGRNRLLRTYDAINDVLGTAKNTEDLSGHGSHITSVAVGSLVTSSGLYNGIAPGADLVSVRAFDSNGAGTYADVIRGIDWVVANMSRYGIGVLNLSFSAPPSRTTGTTRSIKR